MKSLKYIIPICLFFVSCAKSVEERSFNNTDDINEYTSTEFVRTLETKLNKKNNGIYAATLPMAWQEVKNTLGELTEIGSPELQEVNKTQSHLNVLADGEYETDVYAADIIIAKAHFIKQLPFKDKLKRFDSALKYDSTLVSCFGFMGNNNQGAIAYYSTNYDFCIKLQPEDEDHEIILLKSDFEKEENLAQVYNTLRQKIAWFNEHKTEENTWRYGFNEEDIVKIPLLSFNIEKTYTNMMGTGFTSPKRRHNVQLVYQQIAFLLDETGAVVESNSIAMTDSIGEEVEQPQPKKLIFDKPFVIMLKRKDAEYPYFAMYVATSELMVPFKKD